VRNHAEALRWRYECIVVEALASVLRSILMFPRQECSAMLCSEYPRRTLLEATVARTTNHRRTRCDGGAPPTTTTQAGISLIAATHGLAPVTLAQLDEAQLHDRDESKVILQTSDVPEALLGLASEYFVLEHEGERLQCYSNEYFDTAELRNYHEHHNQKGRRLKLRYRTYMNSDITFFEVKTNVNGRTVKERRRSQRPDRRLLTQDALFLFKRTGQPPSSFVPSLSVDYQRILLVRRDFTERVTIDLNVSFSTTQTTVHVPGLAICEFKQPKLDRRSPAIVALNRRPQNFSKYCMGLASCDPSLRRNRFKKVFRNLEALDAVPTIPTAVAA
jgi:hypothetical protein